jgi:hypothetical protein
MRRKSVRIACGIVSINQKSAEKAEMVIEGPNSSGAKSKVTIELDHYDFPNIIQQMAKIARMRVAEAQRSLERVLSAATDTKA